MDLAAQLISRLDPNTFTALGGVVMCQACASAVLLLTGHGTSWMPGLLASACLTGTAFVATGQLIGSLRRAVNKPSAH